MAKPAVRTVTRGGKTYEMDTGAIRRQLGDELWIAAGEWHENEVRKDFTPSERVAITDKVRAEIGSRQGKRTDVTLARIRDDQGCTACKHCERVKVGGSNGYVCLAIGEQVGSDDFFREDMPCSGDTWEWDGTTLLEEDDELPADWPEVEPRQETRTAAAKAAGFSSTTEYRRAKTVVERGTPELVAKMDSGEVSISRAASRCL